MNRIYFWFYYFQAEAQAVKNIVDMNERSDEWARLTTTRFNRLCEEKIQPLFNVSTNEAESKLDIGEENVWQWYEFKTIDHLFVNISMSHLALENNPIKIFIDFTENTKDLQKVTNELGQKIAKAVECDVYTGKVDYVGGDDYEYTIEQTFMGLDVVKNWEKAKTIIYGLATEVKFNETEKIVDAKITIDGATCTITLKEPKYLDDPQFRQDNNLFTIPDLSLVNGSKEVYSQVLSQLLEAGIEFEN